MGIQPNVILLMMDQLSEKWFDAALSGVCNLPNFKKLIQIGTRFTNMYCSNPVCSPERATIATGVSARCHGVLQNGYGLDPKLPTFMETLRDSGYDTALFGKLHLRPHFESAVPDYSQFGFQTACITEDDRAGVWLDWIRKEHGQYYEKVLATNWAYRLPTFLAYGDEKENLQERIKEIREKFDWTEGGKYPDNCARGATLPFPKELSQTEWITDCAIEYLKKIKTNQPFFTQISYVAPHSPFNPPEEYLDKVKEEKIPAMILPEWKEKKKVPHCFAGYHVSMENNAYMRKCYFADLMHLDEQVGEIMDCLEKLDLMDSTYLIFLSDHGELLGDHGFYSKGPRHYDACIHVPLIIAGPGLQKNKEAKQMVQHEDICPTILDLTKTKMKPMPKLGHYMKVGVNDIPYLSGHSLVEICKGGDMAFRNNIYCESYTTDVRDWARTIRTLQYRYTYFPLFQGEQLFRIDTDPNETCDLSETIDYETVKRELKLKLMEAVMLQDWPHTRRELFAVGVH